ncbi:DUF1616 domain-containing protein [Halorhabdus sp. CUG00001]|uniref:DUF1616 domain-containing protein n=1 Tax=Halorhabdus sp. CUG00001 TaxID=2600297 RepID=UPI00131B80D8|nr:DUF1616 domain-containing protein [Halorhabdus sp. CUG00001]
MVDGPDWRLLVPESIRRLPADLAAMCLLVVLTVVFVFVPVLNETPLRVLFGLAFVLFVPGYAFVAALFPEVGGTAMDGDERDASVTDRAGIDGIERVALSFGLSIAIVPLTGLVLNFTPWGIRLGPIVVSLTALTMAFVAVAAHRRRRLPAEERLDVPYRAWLESGQSGLFEPDSRTDAALNVLLVLSVLLATASVAYGVMVPKQGEAFTELYVLNDGDGGELVADNYPQNVTVGESKPLVVGIGNHEHEPMDYTVVVALQRVEREGNTTTVLEEQELDRLTASIQANGTWQQRYGVQPTMTGEDLRLAFLLYRGDPPTEPTIENAYRENHLFVNVTSQSD